jgi:hypothetical protein
MGISLRDQSGKLRRSEDLLADVADAFARIEDPAERVRLAFELFDSGSGAKGAMLGFVAGGNRCPIRFVQETLLSPDVLWGDIGGTGSARIARRWSRIVPPVPSRVVIFRRRSAAGERGCAPLLVVGGAHPVVADMHGVVSGPPQTRCE